MNTPASPAEVRPRHDIARLGVLAGSVAAGLAGLWWGYGFGEPLGGLWLGVLAAANCGALCTFLADSALSRLFGTP